MQISRLMMYRFIKIASKRMPSLTSIVPIGGSSREAGVEGLTIVRMISNTEVSCVT